MQPRVNKILFDPDDQASDTAISGNECTAGLCREPDRDTVVFCRQVNGPAPAHVCVIYRAQTADTGGRACEGCIIDAVLRRPQDSVRDCVRIYNA